MTFRLIVKGNSAPQVIAAGMRGPAGPVGPEGSSEVTRTAGEILHGHRAVYSDGDTAWLASSDNLDSAERCAGITLGAALEGADVRIQRAGPVYEATWSWTPGPVYLADGGVLTQVAPTAGVALQIGVALSARWLDVRLGTPISLE